MSQPPTQPDQPPPQGPPGQPYPQTTFAPPPGPPPKKKRTGLWVALGIVGLVLLLVIGGCFAFLASLGDGSPEEAEPAATSAPASPGAKTSAPPKAEAKPFVATVTKCERGEYGSFDVIVKITNNTENQTNYIFDLLLLDKDDNTVGSGFGSVEVKPGKSANSKVIASLDDDSYKGKVKCEVKVTDYWSLVGEAASPIVPASPTEEPTEEPDDEGPQSLKGSYLVFAPNLGGEALAEWRLS